MQDELKSQAHWSQIILKGVGRTGFAVPAERLRELWFNPLNPHSLRLTKFGLQIATVKAELTTYAVDLDVKILPKHFLLLEKACTSPYYVKKLDELLVFDQKTAVMIQLHAGDFDAYFSNTLRYG